MDLFDIFCRRLLLLLLRRARAASDREAREAAVRVRRHLRAVSAQMSRIQPRHGNARAVRRGRDVGIELVVTRPLRGGEATNRRAAAAGGRVRRR